MAIEREVAGMRCGDVLAELSDFLDGELRPERRAQVTAHLHGCDVCERFGSAFTAAIEQLRQGAPTLPGEALSAYERLHLRLQQAVHQDRA